MWHSDRLSAADYITKFSGKSDDAMFPESFGYLFELSCTFLDPGLTLPESRIKSICLNYSDILFNLTGKIDKAGAVYFKGCAEMNMAAVAFLAGSELDADESSSEVKEALHNLLRASLNSNIPDLEAATFNVKEESASVFLISFLCSMLRNTRYPQVLARISIREEQCSK